MSLDFYERFSYVHCTYVLSTPIPLQGRFVQIYSPRLYFYKGGLFKSILLVSISTREICLYLFSSSLFLRERFVHIYPPRLYFSTREVWEGSGCSRSLVM